MTYDNGGNRPKRYHTAEETFLDIPRMDRQLHEDGVFNMSAAKRHIEASI